MVLKHILRMLMNEQVIRKLSESYPMRRAAQLTAYFIHKGKEIGEDRLERLQRLRESDLANRMRQESYDGVQKYKISYDQSVKRAKRANGFFVRFFNAFNEEWKKAKKPIEEERMKELGNPPPKTDDDKQSRRDRRRKSK